MGASDVKRRAAPSLERFSNTTKCHASSRAAILQPGSTRGRVKSCRDTNPKSASRSRRFSWISTPKDWCTRNGAAPAMQERVIWVINNQGDVYTVDSESFDRTYRLISPGVLKKMRPSGPKKRLSLERSKPKRVLQRMRRAIISSSTILPAMMVTPLKAAPFHSLLTNHPRSDTFYRASRGKTS